MQIDWFTYVAQIVNFLILVALLYRFLYGPIMRGMAAREQAIADRFQDAEAVKTQAQAEIERYRRLEGEFNARRDDLLAQATADADARRKEMIQAARNEVEDMLNRWYEGVEREQAAFLADAREHLATSLVLIARRALSDLADTDLEYKVVDHFVARLKTLPDYERHALIVSAAQGREAGDHDVVIRSAFELPYAKRQQVIDSLQELVVSDAAAAGVPRMAQRDNEIGVRFDVNPDLICGIEMLVHDRRVAWSVRDYVASVQHDLTRASANAAPMPL